MFISFQSYKKIDLEFVKSSRLFEQLTQPFEL